MTASWHGMPEELQLQIATQTTTIDRYRRPYSFGFPNVPDLNTTFVNLNEDTLRLYEIICREFLHIQIWLCGCGRSDVSTLPGHLSNNFGRNRHLPGIADYERMYDLNLSAMQIEVLCTAAATQPTDGSDPSAGVCERKQVRIATFLAEPDMMLTLYGLLQSYVSETFCMEVKTNILNNQARPQALKILDDMRKVLCNIHLLPTSILPSGCSRHRLATDVGKRVIHAKDLVETFEGWLDTVTEVMMHGIPLEQIVSGLLMYEGTVDTENLQNDNDMFAWPTWPMTRRYLYELELDSCCAILQGVAFHMLTRALNQTEQAHFHVNAAPGLGKLEYTLGTVDTVIWTYNELMRHNMVNPGLAWLVPVLYARVLILIAWARLNTLQKSPIAGHNIHIDTPLPDGVDFVFVGDNTDEVFNPSAWGTPSSMMLVARRDLKRINEWATALEQGPMSQGIRNWVISVEHKIVRIEEAQRLRKLVSHAQAVRHLNVQMANPHSVYFPFHLRKGAARVALHAQLEADNWEMD